MISRHVIYCDHYPDGAGEAGSNARERKPATVSHEIDWMGLFYGTVFDYRIKVGMTQQNNNVIDGVNYRADMK